MQYRPRIADALLRDALAASGAVLIEGPRACGKTETARRLAASEVLLDIDDNARAALAIDPSLLLEGPVPRLIDEWQIGPGLWNRVRRLVDDRRETGQFILTGSAVPPADVTRHTGSGRISRLRMRPMTSQESGRSTGAVSLAALLDGGRARAGDNGVTVPTLLGWLCTGGWPALVDRSPAQARRVLRGYLADIAEVDLPRIDGSTRDPGRVARLLRSLARNTSTYASVATLAADTAGPDGPIDDGTTRIYLAALGRLMVTDDQPSWGPTLRSRSRLRSSDKRQLVDPSLAAAALGAGPTQLLNDLRTAGFLFESMVIRDLRVYGEARDLDLLQYRDNTGLEVDAILVGPDGRWAAVEIKLGPGQVEEAARTLLTFAAKIDPAVHHDPDALLVVTGTGLAYTRPDGVHVVPVGLLGP